MGNRHRLSQEFGSRWNKVFVRVVVQSAGKRISNSRRTKAVTAKWNLGARQIIKELILSQIKLGDPPGSAQSQSDT